MRKFTLVGTVALLLLDASLARAQLSVRPCEIAANAARCGTLRVPEDGDNANGRTIALNVIVLPRRRAFSAREPLFVLGGGPGQAITAQAESLLSLLAPIRADRDVVLVDRRGTGGPGGLNWAIAPHTFFIPTDPQQCVARLTQKANLALYGTEAFVEDLERARATLGYDVLSLYGASYGTRAAYAYARRYPARVRSLVLVSPAPLSVSMIDSVEEDGRRALTAIVDDCASDRACSRAFPNVKADSATITQALDPFRAMGLQFLEYSAATARAIPYLITEAARGRLEPLDGAIGQVRDEVIAQLSIGLHLTIMCSEDLSRARTPAPGTRTSPVQQEYARACEHWPSITVRSSFFDQVAVDRPALIVSGAWDPVTSPRWAHVVADQFSRSQVVVVPKSGHLFVGLDSCLGKMTAEFLDHGAADPSCAARVTLPAFQRFPLS